MLQEFINLPWPKIILLFCLFYIFLMLFAWMYADRALFPHPDTPSYTSPEVDFEVLNKSGHKISCFYFKAKNPNGLTILYSHGNGEDLGMLRSHLNEVLKFGCDIIAYDYPGYGLSEGSPSEDSCFDSIDSVYQHAKNELKVDDENIILWGRSLGSGPSCYLASKKEVGAIILESPFLTAFRTVTEISILPWDKFRNIDFVRTIKSPSLIIHGRWDEVVPYRQGKKLHFHLPHPKEFLEIKDASHNDLVTKGGVLYHDTVRKFINSLL